MKRLWIPTTVIIVFFVVFSLILKNMNTPTQKIGDESQVERALKNIGNQNDPSVKLAKNNLTIGDKVPSWGSLKAMTLPKAESVSFKGTTTAAKDTKKVADNKKKKKKKKVAKKDKKKKSFAKSSAPKKIEDSPTESNSIFGVGGAKTITQVTEQNRDDNRLPETLEEWEAYVLSPPNLDRLMDFIKYHQAKLVLDDIFYALSEKMITDSREEIRKFGILALGSSPSLEAFIMLALVSETERSSALQSLIETNYNTYTAVRYLGVLAPALRSENTTARFQAALNVGRSAEMNLQAGSTGTPSGRGRLPRTDGGGNRQIYEGFLPVLQQLAAQDPDSGVRQAAQRSIEIIENLTRSSVASL